MSHLRRLRPNRSDRLAAPVFAVLLVAGLLTGLFASRSNAASSCSLYASNGGSDRSDGSSTHPFATVNKLVSALGAGQVGCLAAGQTFSSDVNLYLSNGSSSAPVTVTSADPNNPATIYGRVVTHPGADYLVFTNLKFDWNSGGQNLPSVTIGSDHVTLSYDDIQNGNTSICIDIINDSTWGIAHGTVVDHSRVHNCGVRPVTSYSSAGYFSHGLYISGYDTRVTNNYIYANSGKGVLLRGSTGGFVSNNVIDGNGTGVMFGDLAASSNEVAHNVVTNSTAGCLCNSFGAASWWGSTAVGSNNTFHDNCVYGNAEGNVSTAAGGFSATSNTVADPGFVDAGSGNYALRSGSPCAADAPSGAVGPGGSGAAPTSTTSTTTTTSATTTSTTTTTSATTTSTTTTTPTTTTTSPTTTTTPTTTTPTSAVAPTAAGAPTIAGSAVVGSYLTAAVGSWSGTAPMSYAYQWRHCDSAGSCTPVAGATGPNFAPSGSDAGMTIRVSVTATNQAGSTIATSAATSPVIAPPVSSAVPQIAGDPRTGAQLTASTGTWTGANLIYSYNWLRCDRRGGSCSQIPGATSTVYTVSSDDVGARLRVMVSAQNQAGSSSATSDATAITKH
jgi:Right handed beta helix region